jgi:isopenicillin N synthase-like dioxygenase
MTTLKKFVRLVNNATTIIMERLSVSLELPEGASLSNYHRPNMPSSDIIRLLKYHAQDIQERGALHTPHTDLGSLTFLFTRQPGLQILAPNSDEWTWVEPREGCAIVNLGDMMALLTNDYLRSCLHRVAPLPGQAMPTRYSFAYLVRAENKTHMKGLDSPFIPVKEQEEVLTSDDWIKKKFGVLRLDSRKKGQDWVLTGQRKALPA